MGWVSDLLKHITISKSLTASLFIATSILTFGYRWQPDYIQKLPGIWGTVAFGVLVFTGVLLLIWGAPVIWRSFVSVCSSVFMFFYSRKLSDLEKNLIYILAMEFADESMDLRDINYQQVGISKLKFLEAAHKLRRKGFVRINSIEENLISLTHKGRALGLKLVSERAEQGPA